MKLSNIYETKVEEGRLKNLAMAGALLGAGMGAGSMMHKTPPKANPQSTYQQMFHSKAQEAQRKDLRDKGQQLRDKGLKKGTFTQGKLQEPKSDKQVKSSSTTSDSASDYL